MPLFHPRVIKKHLTHIQKAPKSHLTVLNAWAKNLANGTYDSETQNDGEFIQRILIDVLGYVGSSTESKTWTVAKNQPVGRGNVDVALGKFAAKTSEIIAPFELKGAKTKDLDAMMAGRHKTPVQQAWEYAMDVKGAKWVLVSNYRSIRLYAVGHGRKNYETFDLSKLNEPEEYARFILLLSANNILGGTTLSFLEESEKVDKEITNKLYSDYKSLRTKLLNNIQNNNPSVIPLKAIEFTQTFLDRILFIAFAEDKGLLPEDTIKHAYDTQNAFNPQPIWENFKGLFRAINKGNNTLKIPAYNGGLFAENSELDNLKISDELCMEFKNLSEYDFDSDVSVNILGHIFEQSIADLEELKAKTNLTESQQPKLSKRKKDGIFYTPSYITHTIVEESVGAWLNKQKAKLNFDALPELKTADYESIKIVQKGRGKNRRTSVKFNSKIKKHIDAWEAYKLALSTIKVLDPACGSGAFLNEAFDFLKAEGEAVNTQLAILKGEQTSLFRWDTHILTNNLYGVDLNSESVEITKLSLWLKTANKQEKLTYLDENIKVGNSLIDESEIPEASSFHWNKEFKSIIASGGFDVILGNPPYAGIELIDWNDRRWFESNYEYAAGRFDLYSLFIEKSKNLLKSDGFISFIIPNKFLRNVQFSAARLDLLNNFSVSITLIEERVFKDANVESIILKLYNTSGKKTYSSFSLGENHNGRNFIPVEKIKNTKGAIFSSTSSSNNTVCSKMEKGNLVLSDISETRDGIVAGKIKDLVFLSNPIDSNSKPLLFGRDIIRFSIDDASYWVNYKPTEMMEEEKKRQNGKRTGLWMRNKEIFERPKILTRFVASKIIAAYDTNNNYYSHTVHSTHITDKKYDPLFVLCLMNSKLYEYYYKQKNTKAGKLFPQVRIAFLKTLPIKKTSQTQQLQFSEKSTMIMLESTKFQKIVSGFIKLCQTEFSIDKVSKKLDNWYNLTFPDFLKEVEKKIKPEKLSLSQKSEWMDYFEKEKAAAIKIQNTISAIDSEIDHLTYELYKLSPKEIGIVENALN